jgi:aspartyl-tRNA(Asn)/glutamyl-tRNA(Gln) amidotransferase subunit C
VPDSIDRQTVIQTAKLARIELSEDESSSVQQELGNILAYVGHLSEVEVGDQIEPFFGSIESVNCLRPDEVKPSLDRQSVLKNAPESDGEFYLVPQVFKP